MRLSLDYDNTYTLDPAFWDLFCIAAIGAGHEVVCVTMRHPDEPIEMPCEVIYTSRRAKVPFMEERGVKVDVWIDDAPHWLLTNG